MQDGARNEAALGIVWLLWGTLGRIGRCAHLGAPVAERVLHEHKILCGGFGYECVGSVGD